MLYILCKYILRPFLWLLFRPHIVGGENLRIQGKAIFVCNHLSMLDPVVIMLASPRNVHFMAKAELFKGWFANAFFRSLLAFPVERNQADMSSMKKAMRLLKGGKVFGIFPEGKRSVTGELDDIEKGAAFLACRSFAPIVPMYIHKYSYSRFRVAIAAGEPIDVESFIAATPKSKLVDELTNEMSRRMCELKSMIEVR